MDFIFLLTGGICLAEAVLMFMGKDMMIFNETTFKREDFDMPRLSKAEGALFLIDGAGCLVISIFRPEVKAQLICLGVLFVTLIFHWRNFGTDKYKLKKKK